MKLAIQVKLTSDGKLRYRLVQELSGAWGYETVPLTRWCASVEHVKKAHRKRGVR